MASRGNGGSGKTRVGRYELGRTLGEGSFAKAKFARNIETGENVAIKILDKDNVLKHKMIAQVEVSTVIIWAIIIFIGLKSVAAQGTDPDIQKPRWFGDKDFFKVKGINSPIIIITIVCVVLILVVVFFFIWLRHVHAAGLGVAPPVIAQGLDPQVVESFPVLTFPIDGEVGFDITDCHICLEEFLQGENVRVLPACRHIYHIDCIQTWLTRDTQCPDCRHDYVTWELESMPPDLP